MALSVAEQPAPGLPARWSRLRYHPEQARLRRSRARFKVIEAGRRSGKTEIAKRDLIERWAIAPYETGLDDWFGAFFAPTRDQAKAIYWEDLKRLVPPQFVRRVYESDLTIHHVDGPVIGVVGLDKPQRAEGRPIDEARIDEFADMKQGVWAKNLRPALDTEGRPGNAWIYGVARPSAEFARLAEYAKSGDDPDWDYFWWPSSDILSPEKIEAARRELDERTFEQEYGGKRVPASGRAYYAFDRTVHVRESLPYDPNAPLYFCLDFNIEPGAAVICQDVKDPELGDCTYVLGEINIPRDSNTPTMCRKFIADWGQHKGQVRYVGDPTGGNRGTAKVDGTDWELVYKHLKPAFGGHRQLVDYVGEIKSGQHGDKLRINAVNTRLRNASGDVRMLIAKACQGLIVDLDNMLVKEGTDGELDKKRDPTQSHWSDGLGYFCLAVHPIREHMFSHQSI